MAGGENWQVGDRHVFQVRAYHFCAGGVMVTQPNGAWVVREAAPIIKYMIGWSGWEVKKYCDKKNWEME